jgi:hypothetical protein
MWGPLWGSFYWRFLHFSAQSYLGKVLTEEESKQIKNFLILIARLLGCSYCSLHAMKYVLEHPPNFETGQQYWDYEFTFHNHVNESKQEKSLALTREEAQESLTTKMTSYGFTMDQINDVFVQDFWSVLLFTCLSYTNTPDKPNEMEQNAMKQFLLASCYTLPFNQHVCADQRLARDHLTEFLLANCDVSTRDNAFLTVTNMYNVLALEFGKEIRTVAENKEIFQTHFDPKTYPMFVRAQEIHHEDQLKMIALQKQLHNVTPIVQTTDEEYWKNVTIALSVVLGFLILLDILWIVKFVHKSYKKPILIDDPGINESI